mgnify:CR=1 FL=1
MLSPCPFSLANAMAAHGHVFPLGHGPAHGHFFTVRRPPASTLVASVEEEMAMLEGFIRDLIETWRYQSRVQGTWYTVLVLLYACMILFGATGNLLVILVVVRNAAMRTARNVFIVNLAVSDLMLCLITMPLTLIEILYLTWQFGNIEVQTKKGAQQLAEMMIARGYASVQA